MFAFEHAEFQLKSQCNHRQLRLAEQQTVKSVGIVLKLLMEYIHTYIYAYIHTHMADKQGAS
jgi:hypothetical protein